MQVQTFLQSAFLQALSHSLIATIWQMGLLWFATITLLKSFKFSAAQKFNIAFIAQFSGLVLFAYTLFHNYNIAAAGKNFYNISAETFLSKINTVITVCMPYLASAYLCILIIKLSRLIFSYKQTKAVRKYQLKKISPAYRIFVQQTAELFSLHKKVKIYLSEKIICPLTIGFLKPIILIPVAAVNHLTTEQMEAVILHELAHIKRADYLLFVLQNLADKIFFFNIFSNMLSDIIEKERENACDDWVLQFRYNSMHYAEALFKLGRLKALPVAMPFSGRKESLLLSRIKRLLHSQSKNSYSLQSSLLVLVSIVIAAFLIISSSAKTAEQKINADTRTVINSGENKNIAQAVSEKKSLVKQAVSKEIKKHIEAAIFNDKKIYAENEAEPINVQAELEAERNALAAKQNYLIQAQQSLDSIRQLVPEYQQAINSQVVVTPEVLQKVISYQNFKRIEEMLAASGDSINITETKDSKNSYRKQITIEAKDKNGNKHIYNVVVELYQ